MAENPPRGAQRVTPYLAYADAPAALDFLCRAFGFERHLVVPGEKEGSIAHAQLRFGNGMVMLGSAGTHGGGFDELMTTPREAGGRCTGSVYVVVEDPDAHHERAVAEGAEVVMPLVDQDYGGRGYSCRDPEGHVWSFGDYDPLAD